MVFLWFTEEEINNMKLELDKYGIQMPSFSKIGGLLANELSVDEAACKTDGITCVKGRGKGLHESPMLQKNSLVFIHKDLTMPYKILDRQKTLSSLTANTILLIIHAILHL